MLLLVGPPERSTARNIWPVSPTPFKPLTRLPPRFTVVVWSNVGVTPGFCALVERMHQKLLPPFPPPMKRFPLVATSSVPHLAELGRLSGLCHVTPASVDRLNSPLVHVAAGLHAWYWKPWPVPFVLSMVNHCLSPPPAAPSGCRRVHAWPPLVERQMLSQNVSSRLL